MILLRNVRSEDLDGLEKLATIPGFINLQNDRDFLRERIARSQSSFFSDPFDSDQKYIFVAEDVETRRVIGTSMIAAQHGTAESPHFYFEVSTEEKYSETISTGFIHGLLKLKYDTNGPSEIGGLVLDPEHRNSNERVGRQISFVRFLYLALNRNRFKKKLIAELLPPLNKKGQSPLWEAIGRRFTNMDYWEADQLCQKNKEFIFSLFPSGKIYTSFLSAEARNAIGKVGKETEPVLHMLKKIGFQYKNQVDPFDGGPHLWAAVEDLLPVKRMKKGVLSGKIESAHAPVVAGLLSPTTSDSKGDFMAVSVEAQELDNQIGLSDENLEKVKRTLNIVSGASCAFMPFY